MLQPFCMAAGFEDREMPGYIAVLISKRIIEAMAYPCLRSEMDDAPYAMIAHEARHGFSIGDIDAMKGEVLLASKCCEPRFLQRRVIIVIDDVDTDDRFAPIEQPVRCCVADKSRRSGNDEGRVDAHQLSGQPQYNGNRLSQRFRAGKCCADQP